MARHASRKIPPDVIEEAEANGWIVEERDGLRVRFTHPCGAQVYACASGDPRAWKNTVSRLRRELRARTGRDTWQPEARL